MSVEREAETLSLRFLEDAAQLGAAGIRCQLCTLAYSVLAVGGGDLEASI